MHVVVHPLRQTLTQRQATFKVTLAIFIAAAHEAAPQIVNAFEQAWTVDGYKSDRLFLRLDCDPALHWFAALETELDLTVTPEGVTVGVLTRSEALLEFFDHFTSHLSRLIPRRIE